MRNNHVYASAALLLGLAGLPSYGQFSTVLNLPPDTIPFGTTIGSDTQVNFFAGGSMGSNVNFGAANGTSTNIEFNVIDGSITSNFNLNPGATANVSGGLISNLSFKGEAVNVSGGTITTLQMFGGDGTIDVTGGLINNLAFSFINPAFDTYGHTINISGGEVRSSQGIGYHQTYGFLPGGTINITDGIVNITGPIKFINAENLTVTGGNITGSLTTGGTGSVSNASVFGSVGAHDGGTMTLYSGTVGGVGAENGGRTNLLGGTVNGIININGGGHVQIDGATVNGSGLIIYDNAPQYDPASLGISSGSLTIERLTNNGGVSSTKDHSFTVTGGTVQVNEINMGEQSRFRMTGGTLNPVPASTVTQVIDVEQFTLLGGTIGDGYRLAVGSGSFNDSTIELFGGSIGDNTNFFWGSISNVAQTLIMGTTIGHHATFNAKTTLLSGSIGNDASFDGDLFMAGGSIGNDAEFDIESQITLLGGSIGDRLTTGFNSFGLTVTGGSIGNDAVTNGTLLMTNGSVGNGLTHTGSASITNGSIGHDAVLAGGLTMTGGSIGNNAEFGRRSNSINDPHPIMISGGSIGDDAEFFEPVTLSGGTIGERATFDQEVNRIVIIGSQFTLDGINLSATMKSGESMLITERDVLLTGILSDGSAFDFLLSDNFADRGVTDYFYSNVSIVITRIGNFGPDLDGDGDVDDADFGIAFAAFTGPGNGPSSNPDADLDDDDDVDDADFGLAFAAFTGPGIAAHVPEPASIGYIAIGGLLLARRRRVACVAG